MIARHAWAALTIVVSAACSHSGRTKPADSVTATPQPTPTVTPSETVLTGKIVAGGLADSPITQLQIEGAKPATLVGPLEPELRRLGGAMVWVTGAPVTTQPNVTFSVSRYEIVSIDGAKPLVGIVAPGRSDPILVMERDTVRLTNAPTDLRSRVGAKVWVVGRRAGADVSVQSFGVIREP